MNKEELLQYSISYIENRIQLVDSKANMLIAIQGGIFGAVTWVIDKLFLSGGEFKILSQLLIAATAVFSGMIIINLLQTIRPTKRFFSNQTNAGAASMKNDAVKVGIMWPANSASLSKEAFDELLDNVDEKTATHEFKTSLFVSRRLVFKKYHFYRRAVWLLKIEVALMFASFTALSLYKAFLL